jgi:hypothetical protein
MPWRRYWVTVLSGVMPTQRPLAITASQSSMSVVCSTAGSVPGGHRSVVVVPVRRSMATVRSSRVTERRRAQGSSASRAQ